MPKQKQKYLLPILALISANVLWGINYPMIKLGTETIPVIIFIASRFFMASILLLPFALKDWRPLKGKYLWMMTLASIMWIAFTAVTLNTGLQYAPSINAGIINLLAPVLLCILSVEFLKEHMSFNAFIGVLFSFAGAAIIIGKPWEVALSGHSVLLGNVLIFASMLGTVISTLLAKPVLKKMSAYQGAFMFLFPGVVAVIPFAIFEANDWNISGVSTTSYIALAYGTIAIAIANLLFIYGLKNKTAYSTGIFAYIESVALFIAAWFLLGEKPSWRFAAGAVLVFAGVYLAEIKTARKIARKLKRKNK